MFIISAALQQQPASHPLPHRVGLALAAVGPSITLAGKHWACGCDVRAALLGCIVPSTAMRLCLFSVWLVGSIVSMCLPHL